jgi:hypothetical protein
MGSGLCNLKLEEKEGDTTHGLKKKIQIVMTKRFKHMTAAHL